MTGRGLEQRMQPCLVPASSPLGQLEGGTNMVVIEGDAVGQIVLRGAGAGEGPTASAVLADICDIARGVRGPVFGRAAASLEAQTAAQSQLPAPYYLRMALVDRPGALAKIATVLGEAGVSIYRMRQYEHESPSAPVLIVTHKTTPAALAEALGKMEATGVMAGEPVALRIEEV
jgi:homoserine dehydrogenase